MTYTLGAGNEFRFVWHRGPAFDRGYLAAQDVPPATDPTAFAEEVLVTVESYTPALDAYRLTVRAGREQWNGVLVPAYRLEVRGDNVREAAEAIVVAIRTGQYVSLQRGATP